MANFDPEQTFAASAVRHGAEDPVPGAGVISAPDPLRKKRMRLS
jgi:hypothetical protein